MWNPRPEVIVDFEYENGLLYISICNIGTKSAHDVSVKFDKPIKSLRGDRRITSTNLFRDLTFLPPGKKIRTFVDTFQSYLKRKQPLRISTVVTYRMEGRRGRMIGKARHNLTIYHDLAETGWTNPSLTSASRVTRVRNRGPSDCLL